MSGLGRPVSLIQTLAMAAVPAYVLLLYLSNTGALPRALAAALAVFPPLLLLTLWSAHRSRRALLAASLTGAGALALALVAWPAVERHYALLEVIQDCALYLTLALAFGLSLGRRQTPLCTRLAGMVRGALPPEVRRYTRQITAAWCLFFVALGTASILIYVLAPLRIWALFANLLALPLIGLMFAVEYAVRRHVLPQIEHHGPLAALRAYLAARGGALPRG